MIATPTFPDLAALVVDESLYVRRILRDMLARVGIKRVQEAPDGAEALGVLGESKPDLVILDWDLAILSGEEFIRLTDPDDVAGSDRADHPHVVQAPPLRGRSRSPSASTKSSPSPSRQKFYGRVSTR